MFFFLFLVAFINFFTSPAHNENVRLRLALAIPIGVPVSVANDAIEMLPLSLNCSLSRFNVSIELYSIDSTELISAISKIS